MTSETSGLSNVLVRSGDDSTSLFLQKPSLGVQTPSGHQRIVPDTGVLQFAASAPSAATDGTSVLPRVISDNWGRILRAGLSEKMQARLIHAATARRQPNARTLTSQSLAEFLDFWNRVRAVAVEPQVTVAPDGTLWALWFRSDRERLDIRFTPNGALYGLVSAPEIHEGAASVDSLVRLLENRPDGPLKWSA